MEAVEYKKFDEHAVEQYVASDEIYIRGLLSTKKRTALFIFLSIITVGIFFILCRMKPIITAKIKFIETSLDVADHTIIRRQEEGTWMHSIAPVYSVEGRRFFDYMCVRYVYSGEEFEKVGFQIEKIFSVIHAEHSQGLDEQTAAQNLALYRHNLIEVPLDSYGKLLLSEVLHPFFLFQLFSFSLWMSDGYYSIISTIMSVVQTRKNRQKLRDMVKTVSEVSIIRNGRETRLSSTNIVPGDLVVIEPNTPVPCDLIVLSGSVVVNESSLTGESIPVLKSPLPNSNDERFDVETGAKYTLFNGTTILQTRAMPGQLALGLAFSTGFSTLKGELIRSIMFPQPTKFKFYRDSIRFIGFLAVFAVCGLGYTIGMFISHGAPVRNIVMRGLDLITITVPPALPVAMTVGTAFAVSRLKKEKIYCISPSRVNVSGRIDTMCFDKTGTLTEEGLSVFGAQPVAGNRFGEVVSDLSIVPQPLGHILASCHSLSILDGQMIGDPLDVKMFEATRWELSEADSQVTVTSPIGNTIRIVRSFEFSSLLQRMSVIVSIKGEYYLFAKGSPEMMKELSLKYTLPEDFDDGLVSHTHQGKRVLGLGMKKLQNLTDADVASITRQEAESDLEFQGLLILQNQLKSDTASAIQMLQNGFVTNVMVTGDNEFTAISVARQCHIINDNESVFLVTLKNQNDSGLKFEYVPKYGEGHRDVEFTWDDPTITLAVNGKAFQYLKQNKELLDKILHKATVYSRMSPVHKAELVMCLQELDLTVGMCGDGANDCGALKAADVGLSLSDAEASVAAPFTSKKPTINSVFVLLKEGRCALISSMQVYKYMACYSLLQSTSIWILYSVGYDSRFRDGQFLWIDMALLFPLSFLMGRTKPRKSLSKHRPSSSLLSATILVSILLQIVVHVAFQVGVFLFTKMYYVPVVHPNIDSVEDEQLKITIVFLFANFQYISTVMSYSIHKPFRRGLHSNFPFFIAISVLTLFCIYLLLTPDPWTMSILSLSDLNIYMKFGLLGTALVNFGIVYMLEYSVVVSCLQTHESRQHDAEGSKLLRQRAHSIKITV